ncbi:Nitrilase family, member 2 [Seminavis robusta]|uniref:Nitrilase family, member 2 n=1 Tax=Seminavis robusta TaxID=568900 RepID=A0A9N8DEW9_9STRA|nr:Nitrilase family, member 2 [Seminavis robusta]|eukprot:Sro61_g034940.1 Nitrilase family, member 2 (415) ;mRNA; f:37080-38782
MMHQDPTKQGDGKEDEEDVSSRNYGSAMIPLGPEFQPGESDVMVGRGKMCREWSGNTRFRDLVASRLDEYSSASSKLEKSAIVTSVLFAVRNKSPNGGFIKKDPLTGEWYEVGDFVARERVTQSFRDALHDKYRSSNSSKKKRRKEELKKAKAEQTESPAKKAKTEPDALRAASAQHSGQISLAGLQSSANPAMTMEHHASLLLHPSSLAGGPVPSDLTSSLPPLSASSQASSVFASGLPSILEPSDPQQGTAQQLQAFQMQSRGGSGGLFQNIDQQLQALQRLNSVNQRQPESYPQSWFSVNQQQQQPSALSRIASITSGVAAAGSVQNQGNPIMPGHVASASLLGPATTAINPSSLGPFAPAACESFTPALLASAPVSFGAYADDDNPFEPVPIAEDISRRNSARGGEEKTG